MNISAWSIKRPIPIIVLFLVLTFAGSIAFGQLGVDDTPNIDVPVVQITVTQPGAGPNELESQVTRKIEDAVIGLGDIEDLVSTVNEGVSVTTINFELGVDSEAKTNEVRNALSQVRQELPQDINEPIVKKLEFAGGAIATYVVRSKERSVEELSELVDREIAGALLEVSGVAQVSRSGGVDREVRIQLDPLRLKALGLTATQVNDRIRGLNADFSGGRTEAAGSEKTLRTLGSARSVEDLRNYRIPLPSGGDVPLSNLGEVIDGFADSRESSTFITREGTENVVAFSILRSPGSTLVSVEEGVAKAVETLDTETLPEDIEFERIFTLATNIRESYQASIDDLISGCLLTTLTVGPFLKDWRALLITGLTLPLSIIPTFLVMKGLDYTLNGMTCLALSLAVGNLVDDAICMIENIDTHLLMGKRPYQAALDAAREIGLAVVATTATIVAVFLPVAFMGGVPGQFFRPFGVTVAVASMFSTLVAITITPMISAYLLKSKTPTNALSGESSELPLSSQSPSRQPGFYRATLNWALRNRITTLIIAVVFFIASLQLVPLIPKGLFVSGDRGVSTISVELPPGSTLAETEAVCDRVARTMLSNPATANTLIVAGSSGTRGNINTGTIYVVLKPKEERTIRQRQFEKDMRATFAEIPGARISFKSSGAGGGGKDLSIVLTSRNPDMLMATANELERQMRGVKGLVEVASSASLIKPEIQIVPDLDRAADLGVSVAAISTTANLATLGDLESQLPKFDLPDRQIPIRTQLAEAYRNDLETIANLEIPSQNGSLVKLSAVAEVKLGSSPAQIDRLDRSRKVEVAANLQNVALGDAVTAVNALPALNPLPADVFQKPSGDAEIMIDIFTEFLGALSLAVLCIYAILVLLYNNFLYPLTILVALPLSVGGALLGLLIAQKELGLFALIGIVLLMGLVTKNAILLVDCALENERQGLPRFKAVLEAGISRLRPIVMTAISTIAGMIPIALELGAGGETRSPMAISVIGGFSSSTLLTLVVVPVLFTFVDGVQNQLVNVFTGKIPFLSWRSWLRRSSVKP
ncbi:MAG: efflux RND transporter permease subunit [Oscillatoriales cyanobacterium]|nr:MAG: efflux RND transporter permease subunit [Oscillatoriales cyanobacterium]